MINMDEVDSVDDNDDVVDMSDVVRLSVNLNQETADALHELVRRKGISYTEVLRRAISVHHYLEAETKAGRRIITSDKRSMFGVKHGNVKELVLE